MDALHCTQCGERQPPAARFCPRCGASISVGPTVDPMVGKVVSDRYLLTEKLGQGASGTIYRAEHTTLQRKMAVKILHHELSRDDAAVERFRREATTVGQIDNDHILQVLDFGRTEDQRLYFAMELLEGETLQALVAREKRLAPERAIKILIQIGDALGDAHALGYIHRDLRPRNVFLSVRRGERDFVKLLDFGLAKLIRPDADMRQTAMGMNFGDPHYMSPEQARGDKLDRRSDIFSLGVVAFELLTGETPFRGSGPFDVLQKVLDSNPPSLTTLRGDCPAWLNDVVMKALQKDPEARFPTMLRLVEYLRGEVAPAFDVAANNDAKDDLSDTIPTLLSTPALPPRAAEERASVIPAPGIPAPTVELAQLPTVVTAMPPVAAAAPVASRTLIMQTALPASLAAANAAAKAPAAPAQPVAGPAAAQSTVIIETFGSPSAELDATSPGHMPVMRDSRTAAGSADMVSGEVRTLPRDTADPKGAPTATIVVDASMQHGEPTGPQRAAGDDGWFSDRAAPIGEEEFEEGSSKKSRAPILIGVIAGVISVAGIGLVAFWPRDHKPEKQAEVAPLPVPTPQVSPLPVAPAVAPIAGAPVDPPKPEHVAVAPKPEHVAVAPKPEPVAVAPKPEPVAVAPKPKPEHVAVAPKPAPAKVDPPKAAAISPKSELPKPASTKPTEPVTATKSTRPTDAPTPKGFKDPFAPGANTAGQADTFVKAGRQKLAAGDFVQAQGAFNKAREIDTRNADAYAGLGEVSFELGDYNGATVQLRQALKLSPNRARFLVLLGQSYYKLGRPKEAVTEYKRALRVDPSNQEAQRSLELAEKKLASGG